MPLRTSLLEVSEKLEAASKEPFSNHPLAKFIRGDLPRSVAEALGDISNAVKIDGSPGKGNWATVPWVAVFDPSITEHATGGYYVVYLFTPDGQFLHLSLNQGATSVLEEFGITVGKQLLRDRARLMRARLSDFSAKFDATSIALGKGRLPEGYEAGHALGKTYECASLPQDADLASDLSEIMRAYFTLEFRGGVDPSIDIQDGTDATKDLDQRVVEIRRYRMHRRIERHSRASKLAKAHHGSICRCCGFDFGAVYGDLGEGYIEAHHCTPLSSLREGEPVHYDIAKDFTVLCANCHRMIHRLGNDGDLLELKNRLKHAHPKTFQN